MANLIGTLGSFCIEINVNILITENLRLMKIVSKGTIGFIWVFLEWGIFERKEEFIFVIRDSKRINILKWSQIVGDCEDKYICWLNSDSKQCYCRKYNNNLFNYWMKSVYYQDVWKYYANTVVKCDNFMLEFFFKNNYWRLWKLIIALMSFFFFNRICHITTVAYT